MAMEEHPNVDSNEEERDFEAEYNQALAAAVSDDDDDAGEESEEGDAGDAAGSDAADAGAADGADDVGDAGDASQADESEGDFKPFKVKARGEDVEVKTEAERNELISKGLDYTKKTQELAAQRKAYKGFEAELEKDPELSEAVSLLLDAPSLRKATLALYKRLEAGKKIHPAELENSRFKREQSLAELDETEHAKAEQVERGRTLVQQDVDKISQDLGSKPSPELFQELKTIYAAGRATNLFDAYLLHKAQNPGAAAPSRESKGQTQKRIKQAMTPKAGSRATTPNVESDDEYHRALKRAIGH